MLLQLARKTAHSIAPRWAAGHDRRRWLKQHARELAAGLRTATTAHAAAEMAGGPAAGEIRTSQIVAEIAELVTRLRGMQPKCVGEIGAYRGGTLALFAWAAAADARLLSLDLEYTSTQQIAYRLLAQGRQTVTTMRGDSHRAETLQRVRAWLSGGQFDFLLIDGDHSYEGVKSDYLAYRSLVRPGGLIALHDIVWDHGTRYGRPTGSYVGGVPKLWAELQAELPRTFEIVADREQDGYGIGVIEVPQPKGFRS